MMRTEQFVMGTGSAFRGTLHVGLVNNMPDTALRATEIQFARLLKEAAGPLDVRLRLFSLSSIPRSPLARARMEGFYDDAGMLPHAPVDVLIVTGAQPQADDLRDEPYWRELAGLIDWAQTGTITSLFSCLATHAAVLHLDGIARRALPRKQFGVFTAVRTEDDPLFLNVPGQFPMPHSRRNETPERALAGRGYRVLTRLADGGADIFTRELPGQSRFVFLQGHPEYDPVTLGREYLRDVDGFLRGECAAAPALPENYFDRATEEKLRQAVRTGAPRQVHTAILSAALPLQQWRGSAVRLFANWLGAAAAAKARRGISRTIHTRRRAG
jgi:homoserine O-succinyltransferase